MTNKKIPTAKFLLSLGFISLFTFVIASPDLFPKSEEQIVVNSAFLGFGEEASPDISIDTIIVSNEDFEQVEVGVLHYIVQPGDVLGKIASSFGTTVSKLQKINKINGPIKPGQKLIISNDDVGFLYTMPESINVKIFANKYGLNLEDLMSLNYIQDESEILYINQDIFINISNETAYDNGLLERPKPVVVIKPKTQYKPVINRPQSQASSSAVSSASSVSSQKVFKDNIVNGFYPGFCTWYAAVISPEIFPYVEEKRQERPFGGNANQRCDNAQKAGLKVVWNSSKNPVNPINGSLVIYQKGGPSYSSYGHVAKVIDVKSGGEFKVKEMNYVGKFIVSERKDNKTNSNIKCYITAK